MREIVVPLDGTAVSESALPWAQAIASRSGGNLHLVHVHIPLRVPTCREVLGERVSQTLRQIGEETRGREAEYLEEAGGRLVITHPDRDVSTAVVRGPPSAAVVEHAGAAEATLVVMATRPLRARERLLQGSVTDEIVRQCPIPVLVVRGSERELDEPRVERILVPLDGSAAAEGAVPHAIALARLFGARLVFARVVAHNRPDGAAAERYLEGIRARARPSGLPTETRLVVGRDVGESLLQAATETDTDVVVMASRYRSGLPRLMFGNIAETLVRRGRCPVLVVGDRVLRTQKARSGRVVAWA